MSILGQPIFFVFACGIISSSLAITYVTPCIECGPDTLLPETVMTKSVYLNNLTVRQNAGGGWEGG